MQTEKPKSGGDTQNIDRNLAQESDANDFNDTAPYGNAAIQSNNADFRRNKDGLYGGLPKARDEDAPGEVPTNSTSPRSAKLPEQHNTTERKR